MSYLYSFIAIVFGFLVEMYTYQVVRIFGHMGWAEQRLGSGGTFTVWKIVGIIIIVLGFYNLIHPL